MMERSTCMAAMNPRASTNTWKAKKKRYLEKRNLIIGDVVLLITTGTPRGIWSLGRVLKTLVKMVRFVPGKLYPVEMNMLDQQVNSARLI